MQLRNNKFFNNITKEIDEMVEEVKVLSQQCSLSRLKIPSCLFYGWCWNPKYYL